MSYTPIVDRFQIRDVTYLGGSPPQDKIKFDIVKWVDCDPMEVINIKTKQKEIQTRYCYTVAWLNWDEKEECFDFNSCGLRWLEANPSQKVIQMILNFANMMTEILKNDD